MSEKNLNGVHFSNNDKVEIGGKVITAEIGSTTQAGLKIDGHYAPSNAGPELLAQMIAAAVNGDRQIEIAITTANPDATLTRFAHHLANNLPPNFSFSVSEISNQVSIYRFEPKRPITQFLENQVRAQKMDTSNLNRGSDNKGKKTTTIQGDLVIGTGQVNRTVINSPINGPLHVGSGRILKK